MATAKKTYNVGDHYNSFITKQVQGGRFSNASEVVRAGLRMLEDYETRLRDIRGLIDDADEQIASGQGIEFKSSQDLTNEIIKRGLEKLNREN